MSFPISTQILTLPSIAEMEPNKVDDDASVRFASTHASSMMNIDPPLTRASSEVDNHQPISISDDDDDIEAEIIRKANKKISKTCYVHLSRDSPLWQPKILKKRFGSRSSMPSMKSGQRSLERITVREYKPPTCSSPASNARNHIYEALVPTVAQLEPCVSMLLPAGVTMFGTRPRTST